MWIKKHTKFQDSAKHERKSYVLPFWEVIFYPENVESLGVEFYSYLEFGSIHELFTIFDEKEYTSPDEWE